MIAQGKESYARAGLGQRPADDGWLAYVDTIGKLLDCRPHRHYLATVGEEYAAPAADEADEYYTLSLGERTRHHRGAHALAHGGPSLILLNSPRPAWWRRMSAPRALDRLFGSVLFVRRPRWPLRRILLIVREGETDDAALAWIEKLTAPTWTKVTLLSVTASSHLWPREGLLPPALDILLDPLESGQTALHTAMNRLRELGIQGTVCWRPGAPLEQIRREVRAGEHDLIIVGAEPYSRWRRWQTGGLIGSLLGWADRPVLVAR